MLSDQDPQSYPEPNMNQHSGLRSVDPNTDDYGCWQCQFYHEIFFLQNGSVADQGSAWQPFDT